MKKITKAIIGIAIAVAALAALVPQASAAGEPAVVRVTTGGDMLVRVLASDLSIQINNSGTGSYSVWITDSDGQFHVYNAIGVTRHARIEYRHHLGIDVEFGDLAPSSVPADLRISGESNQLSGNTFTGHDLDVGDDAVFKGDTHVEMIGGKVADDFVVKPASGFIELDINGVIVTDRFYVRRSNTSNIELRVTEAVIGSFSVSGGRLKDSVIVLDSHLGSGPRVLLQGGDDTVQITKSYWVDAFFYRGDDGRDSLGVYGKSAKVQYDVALQDGPDFVFFEYRPSPTSASSFNGGAGFDRITGVGTDSTDVTIVKFEEVNP